MNVLYSAKQKGRTLGSQALIVEVLQREWSVAVAVLVMTCDR